MQTSYTQPLTCELWRALAVVGVNSIHTASSIGTLMTRAVIDVVLTISPIKALHKQRKH